MAGILSLQFWFSMRAPEMAALSAITFAVFALVIFASGIIFKILAGKTAKADRLKAKGIGMFGSWAISLGILLLIWFFFAYEQISVFGARFWILLFGIIWLVWLGFIIFYFLRTIPALNVEIREKQEREKYLPRRA